jgi:hypothetical protein
MDVPTSFDDKFAWLREHFPFIPPSHIVFCGDKSVLDVDYMIDDEPRHFARFRGTPVLFSAPQNAGSPATSGSRAGGRRRLLGGESAPLRPRARQCRSVILTAVRRVGPKHLPFQQILRCAQDNGRPQGVSSL